jgi:hypothetical protein
METQEIHTSDELANLVEKLNQLKDLSEGLELKNAELDIILKERKDYIDQLNQSQEIDERTCPSEYQNYTHSSVPEMKEQEIPHELSRYSQLITLLQNNNFSYSEHHQGKKLFHCFYLS